MKMLDVFKKKKTKKDEQLDNIKMIAIPDIREYMVQGYKEIEQVKQDKEAMKKSRDNYKQDSEKFEKLYDATLITLNEFKQRDEKNEIEIKKLKEKIEAEQEFRKIENRDNKGKINKLEEEIIILNNQKTKIENTTREAFKKRLNSKIKETKGNLSKEKVLDIIKSTY